MQDTFENATKVTHVEDVMELGWGWEHCSFDLVPEHDSGLGETFNGLVHLSREVLSLELVLDNWAVDTLHGDRKDHVKDHMLSLKAVRDVVTATTRVLHSSYVDQVLDGFEVTSLGLIKHVEPTILN